VWQQRQGDQMSNIQKTTQDWTELKVKIKSKWNKFAEADLESFRDNLQLITEKIQTKYGYTKDRAEEEYKDFKRSLAPVILTVVEKVKSS
jgi:uncharacterized protein YjbJ (UPF0337 family)